MYWLNILLIGLFLLSGSPQAEETNCAASLTETMDEIGYAAVTSDGTVIYTEQHADSFSIRSILPNGDPPLLYNGDLMLGVFAISPDEESIIFLPNAHEIMRVPISGGEPETLMTTEEVIFFTPGFLPDENTLIYAAATQDAPLINLYRLPLDTLEPTLLTGNILRRADSNSYRLMLIDDYAIFVGEDENAIPTIFSMDLTTGNVNNLSEGLDVTWSLQPGAYFTFFHASDQLVFESRTMDSFQLNAVALQGGKPITLATADIDFLEEGRPSPDGNYVVYSDQNGLYSVAIDGSAAPVTLSEGFNLNYQDFMFTPDGQSVAFIRDNAITPESRLMLVPVAGGEPEPLDTTVNLGRNFYLRQVGDTLIIGSNFVGSDAYQVYIKQGDNPAQLVFSGVYDYRSGIPFTVIEAFYAVRKDSLVYYDYDGSTTTVKVLPLDLSAEPRTLGCALPGWVERVGIRGNKLFFTANNHSIYGVPVHLAP